MKNSTKKWEHQLEAYLDDKLPERDRVAFEEECFKNDDLLEELKFRQELRELIREEGITFMSQPRQQPHRKISVSQIFSWKKQLIAMGIVLAGMAILFAYVLLTR